MYILAIETTGAYTSVALAETEYEKEKVKTFRILGHIEGHEHFSHLQNLAPQIQSLLEKCGLLIGDIDAIAVSRGPGSFTGIRIGVSTTRALAQILNIPCIAVSSLEALAGRAFVDASDTSGIPSTLYAKDSESDQEEPLLCPILDARRHQVYGAGYRKGREVIEAGPYTIEEFMEKVRQYRAEAEEKGDFVDILFLGDGIDKSGDRITLPDVKFAPEEIRYQDAETVAQLGAIMLAEGRTCTFDRLKPDYMRLAEAERKLRENREKD